MIPGKARRRVDEEFFLRLLASRYPAYPERNGFKSVEKGRTIDIFAFDYDFNKAILLKVACSKNISRHLCQNAAKCTNQFFVPILACNKLTTDSMNKNEIFFNKTQQLVFIFLEKLF